MQPIPFQKQTAGEALYPKLLLNRPISRHGAGRLLLIGGRAGYLGDIQATHALATATGIGECRVALPDSLVKLVGPTGIGEFVPSGPTGALGRSSLGRLLALLEDYDCAVVGPAAGHNSETTLLFESLLTKTTTPMVITGDALTALGSAIGTIKDRDNTVVVATMPELFKLAGRLGVGVHITQDGGLQNKLAVVRDCAEAGLGQMVITGPELLCVTAEGLVSTATAGNTTDLTAAIAGVVAAIYTQNLGRVHQALATSCYLSCLALSYMALDGESQATTNLEASVARALRTLESAE